jgi:hypothetical protein
MKQYIQIRRREGKRTSTSRQDDKAPVRSRPRTCSLALTRSAQRTTGADVRNASPFRTGLEERHSTQQATFRKVVVDAKAGGLIIELSWLRTAMMRFLITFAAAITAGLLALGALRLALLAFGTPPAHVPPLRLLTYGGVLTAITALIFVPAYVAWQERVSDLRDTLHPVPEDGRTTHDWIQARDDLDTLLIARASVGRVLATAFGVLAPLTASVISALLSAS